MEDMEMTDTKTKIPSDEEFDAPSADDLQPDEDFSSPLNEVESDPIGTVISEPIGQIPDEGPGGPGGPAGEDSLEFMEAADVDDFAELAKSANRGHNPRLRLEAGLAYMSEPECNSLQKLRKDPRFAHISPKTLAMWCRKDQWAQRRERFLTRWATEAYRKLGSTFVADRKKSLEMLRDIRNHAADQLTDNSVAPRSWEGMATAFVQVTKHMVEMQEVLVKDMMPMDHEDDSPLTGKSGTAQLSREELESVTAQILQQRRDQIRAVEGIDVNASDLDARRGQDVIEQGSAEAAAIGRSVTDVLPNASASASAASEAPADIPVKSPESSMDSVVVDSPAVPKVDLSLFD